jgi:16S rRNA (cytosine1402-N4)-methyltransferase
VVAYVGLWLLHLEARDRGYFFRCFEPLDRRLDLWWGASAADMLAAVDERTLADVIYEFGEERHARRVARAIVDANRTRRIETTGRLAEIVRKAVPRKGYSRIDPATRTFQAIRIWVNRELEDLDGFLTRAAGRLAPAGRLVVITFHSLEDRVVKHTLRALQANGTITIRTKRPQVPTEAEIERNPRARSAKLRAASR